MASKPNITVKALVDKGSNKVSKPNITVKALVDKGSNKVIFIEPGNDFVDVLFSFLTIPAGRVISLARTHFDSEIIGCIKNLYASVEQMAEKDFKFGTSKDLLLHPRNAAEPYCNYLQVKLDNYTPTSFYMCSNRKRLSYDWFNCCYSHHRSGASECCVSAVASQVGSVFLKQQTKVTVTDGLQVTPQTAATGFAFAQLGVMDVNATEELTITIGTDEILNLLMNSLVSKTPLTETLLKDRQEQKLRRIISSYQGIQVGSEMLEDTKNEEANVYVKLVVSKSKKMVCYAESREDFVNLLFSFLTLPLGFIVRNMKDGSSNGCLGQLLKSVQGFDEEHMNSNHHKEVLIDTQILPGFCYKDSLLGIEEASYYFVDHLVTTDRSRVPSDCSLESSKLKFIVPESCAQGFLKGPAVFVVTDNLVVRPISRIFELSILKDLNVPITDIEDRIVHVGRKEALRLLLSSFVGDSALTNSFIIKDAFAV